MTLLKLILAAVVISVLWDRSPKWGGMVLGIVVLGMLFTAQCNGLIPGNTGNKWCSRVRKI